MGVGLDFKLGIVANRVGVGPTGYPRRITIATRFLRTSLSLSSQNVQPVRRNC